MAAATTIAVLGGTGKQGKGLAQRFAMAGRSVVIGSRDPERARSAIAQWPVTAGTIEVAANADAARRAAVVVLTVPFASLADLLDDIRPQLAANAIVIDVTVPVTFGSGKMAMIDVPEGSAAEHVRARVPAHVAVAGAFKTLPADLVDDVRQPFECDEFICADSDAAREEAVRLVGLLPGLRAVDVGPLSRARAIEHVTALAIAINRRHRIHTARFKVVGLS